MRLRVYCFLCVHLMCVIVCARDWFRLFSNEVLNPDKGYFNETGDGCSRFSELVVDDQKQMHETIELTGCMFAKAVFESKLL